MSAEALFQRGLAEAREGRHEQASVTFAEVLHADPGHLGALVSRGSALLRLRRAEEAEAQYRRALAIAPRQPLAFRNLCILLNDAERHDEALALAQAALADAPGFAPARTALGNALAGLGRLDEALAAFRSLAAAEPAAAEPQAKLGLALAAAGQHEAALAALDRSLELDPDNALTRLRRGLLNLQLHRFGEGWPDYEARWRLAPGDAHAAGLIAPALTARLAHPTRPEQLAGRRILVVGEQGIGDQVMFASLLPDLVRTAAKVTCVVDARLVGLLCASFPEAAVFSPDTARISPAEIDDLVAIGSLGRPFRRNVEAFPGAAYLKPRAERVEAWRARLGPRPQGLRIGLSWRGGTPVTRRATRSMGLDDLAPILALPRCEFVSLQYGGARDELAAAGLEHRVRAFPPEDFDDFEELAALVSTLDVVVSVQTALVHLAGAIGQPCLAMIPSAAEWRYGARGDGMPWYRSVRLFRQDPQRSWAPVVAAVARDLAGRLPP